CRGASGSILAMCLIAACSPRQGARTAEERTAATGARPTVQPNDSETALGAPSAPTAAKSASGAAAPSATVPVKAAPTKPSLVTNFVQNDGTPHSAEVASGEGPLPNSGGDPAIPRAYTNKVVEGLPQGAKDVIRFQTPESGSYRIVCGVPGHALSGMWLWFKI